jgi:hypothetical protein
VVFEGIQYNKEMAAYVAGLFESPAWGRIDLHQMKDREGKPYFFRVWVEFPASDVQALLCQRIKEGLGVGGYFYDSTRKVVGTEFVGQAAVRFTDIIQPYLRFRRGELNAVASEYLSWLSKKDLIAKGSRMGD